MAFFEELADFDKSKLEKAETVVRTFAFVEDTSEDGELAYVVDGLYVGSAGGAMNLEELRKKNVTHIVNLAQAVVENLFPEEFVYKTVEILDLPDFPIASKLDECVEFITEAVESKNGVCLVHCNAG